MSVAKNSLQKLTVTDKEILMNAIRKYELKFYSLKERYPDPREYVETEILKEMKSNANIGALYLLAYTRNSSPGFLFKPRQVNRVLADDMPKATSYEITETDIEGKGFFHPRDLREKLLKKLEDGNVFSARLTSKEEITQEEHKRRRPGKKSPIDGASDNPGGKPSAYKLTNEVEKLKEAMNKSDASEFIHKELIESDLGIRLVSYIVQVFLYVVKIDEAIYSRLMGFGALFMQDNRRVEDAVNFKVLHQQLQSIDNSTLVQYAETMTQSLIEDRDYGNLFYLAGLFEL